jgi:hypothetical protein
MRLHPFLADPMSTTELSFEQPASAVQSVLTHSIETTVRDRYSEGARAPQPALCCPIEYQETQYLTALPDEIIAKDYGCGDPTRFVNEGETVVDLGSGAGKNCYIIAQKVGANGSHYRGAIRRRLRRRSAFRMLSLSRRRFRIWPWIWPRLSDG